MYEKDNENDAYTISSIPLDLIACTEHTKVVDENNQYMSIDNTIHSIEELTRVLNSLMAKANHEIENKWKFAYIDYSLGKCDMTVKKYSNNYLSIIISKLDLNNVDIKRLTQKLQDRLVQKGWISQISHDDDKNHESSKWTINKYN